MFCWSANIRTPTAKIKTRVFTQVYVWKGDTKRVTKAEVALIHDMEKGWRAPVVTTEYLIGKKKS